MKLLDNPFGRNTDGRYEKGGLLLRAQNDFRVQQIVARGAGVCKQDGPTSMITSIKSGS